MHELTVATLLGLVFGSLSMFIYAKLAPQQKLAELKTRLAQSRKTLAGYDGDMRGLFPLIGNDLSITLQQLRLIFIPALVGVAPCMAPFLIWPDYLASTYQITIYFSAIIIVSIYLKIKLRIL